MKNKNKIYIVVSLLVIVACVSGLLIHNKLNNSEVKGGTATEISYNFFETLFPVFNSGSYSDITELYLPCQDEENFGKCYNQIYHEVFVNKPLILEGVLNVTNAKGNTIKGQVVYNDHDGSYNLLEEYDNGWEGFGNKKVANFELVKKNGKMYLQSFEIVANYNWKTIQSNPEFLDLYMNKLYFPQVEGNELY